MPRQRSAFDKDVARRLGAALRAARQAKKPKLTIERLAEKAGLSTDFVARVEEAKHQPSISVFLRLCRALEVPPTTLLDAAGLGGDATVDPKMGKLVAVLAGRGPEATQLAIEIGDAIARAFPRVRRKRSA